MLRLASCQKQVGADEAASDTVGAMLQIFQEKKVPRYVMSKLENEALDIAVDPGAARRRGKRQ